MWRREASEVSLKLVEMKCFVRKKLLQALESGLAERKQVGLSSSHISSSSIQQFSHPTTTQL